MAYDERATALVHRIERLTAADPRLMDDRRARCAAVLNALEVTNGDDVTAANAHVVRNLSDALLLQAADAGVDTTVLPPPVASSSTSYEGAKQLLRDALRHDHCDGRACLRSHGSDGLVSISVAQRNSAIVDRPSREKYVISVRQK